MNDEKKSSNKDKEPLSDYLIIGVFLGIMSGSALGILALIVEIEKLVGIVSSWFSILVTQPISWIIYLSFLFITSIVSMLFVLRVIKNHDFAVGFSVGMISSFTILQFILFFSGNIGILYPLPETSFTQIFQF